VINSTSRPLYPQERDPIRILQEAGWDLRPVWTGGENFAYTEIRSPNRPARSESRYRLSYPGPRPNQCIMFDINIEVRRLCRLPSSWM
jgi:hypothetical protein